MRTTFRERSLSIEDSLCVNRSPRWSVLEGRRRVVAIRRRCWPYFRQQIPSGEYYVEYHEQLAFGTPVLYSQIFKHEFYTTCTDYFTNDSGEPCALYYFQVHWQKPQGECVGAGSACFSNGLSAQSGIRVIPLFEK